MKLDHYLDQLAERFEAAGLNYGHGTDNPRDEAVYLVYSLLKMDFDKPVEQLNRELSSREIESIEIMAEQRIKQRRPVAYLVNEAWFAGHRFICDERALIPRSPIAELIGNRFQPLITKAPGRVLDMCTGGGCIGIACALEFEDSQVELVDVSTASLELAAENIALHGLGERVTTRHSDLFTKVSGRFDLILANPPYVSAEEVRELPQEYAHEPELGLYSDDHGLALPLRILREARQHLESDGLLILEVGFSADLLQERLSKVPLMWLEFEFGGEGVCCLTASQLEQYSSSFN